MSSSTSRASSDRSTDRCRSRTPATIATSGTATSTAMLSSTWTKPQEPAAAPRAAPGRPLRRARRGRDGRPAPVPSGGPPAATTGPRRRGRRAGGRHGPATDGAGRADRRLGRRRLDRPWSVPDPASRAPAPRAATDPPAGRRSSGLDGTVSCSSTETDDTAAGAADAADAAYRLALPTPRRHQPQLRGRAGRGRPARQQGRIRQDAALGDHQLGLLDDHRRLAQLAVQQRGDQRDPARAADQEHPGQPALGQIRPAQQAPGHLHGLVQHRPGQLLQLVAGQVHLEVEQRHDQVGGLGPGQPLLGHPYVVPQLALGPPVGHRLRLDQPAPLRAVAAAGAPTIAASTSSPPMSSRPSTAMHLETLGGTGHHARVERARAEVVHHHDRPDRHVPAQHLGEVGGRGDRLGDQPGAGQPGPGGGLGQQRAPGRAPGGRAGQGDAPGVPGRPPGATPRRPGPAPRRSGRRPAPHARRAAPGRRRSGASGWARTGPGRAGRCAPRRGRRSAGRPVRRTPPRAAAASRRPGSAGPGRPASGPPRRCSRCRSPRRGHAASANPGRWTWG